MQHVKRRCQSEHGVNRGLQVFESHTARLGGPQESGHELVCIVDEVHHIALRKVTVNDLLWPHICGRLWRLWQFGTQEIHHVGTKTQEIRLVGLQAFTAVWSFDEISPTLPAFGQLLDDTIRCVLRRPQYRARFQCVQVELLHNHSFILSNARTHLVPIACLQATESLY